MEKFWTWAANTAIAAAVISAAIALGGAGLIYLGALHVVADPVTWALGWGLVAGSWAAIAAIPVTVVLSEYS